MAITRAFGSIGADTVTSAAPSTDYNPEDMPEVAEVWGTALPRVKQSVTGQGIWAALNACRAVALEDGVLAIGMPHESAQLAGHLKMVSTARLIEQIVSEVAGQKVAVRVIDGTEREDWERSKRRELESRRLQEQAAAKDRTAQAARSNWEAVYEQLGRMYSSLPNKSLPQNRAKYYKEAIAILSSARKEQTTHDEFAERNFARCLERASQYSEVPSALVAADVLRAAGEL